MPETYSAPVAQQPTQPVAPVAPQPTEPVQPVPQEATPTTEQVVEIPGVQHDTPAPAPTQEVTAAPVQVEVAEEQEVDTSLIGATFKKKYQTKEVSKDDRVKIFSSLPTSLDEGRAHPFGEDYDPKAKALVVYSNVAVPEFKLPSYAAVIRNLQERGYVVRMAWSEDNVLASQLAPFIHTQVNGEPSLEIYIPWEKAGEDIPSNLQSSIVSKGPSYEAMFKSRQVELYDLKDAPETFRRPSLERMFSTDPSIAFIFKALDFELAFGYNLNKKAVAFVTNHEIYTDYKVFKEANPKLFYAKNRYTSKFGLEIKGINLSSKSAIKSLESL